MPSSNSTPSQQGLIFEVFSQASSVPRSSGTNMHITPQSVEIANLSISSDVSAQSLTQSTTNPMVGWSLPLGTIPSGPAVGSDSSSRSNSSLPRRDGQQHGVHGGGNVFKVNPPSPSQTSTPQEQQLWRPQQHPPMLHPVTQVQQPVPQVQQQLPVLQQGSLIHLHQQQHTQQLQQVQQTHPHQQQQTYVLQQPGQQPVFLVAASPGSSLTAGSSVGQGVQLQPQPVQLQPVVHSGQAPLQPPQAPVVGGFSAPVHAPMAIPSAPPGAQMQFTPEQQQHLLSRQLQHQSTVQQHLANSPQSAALLGSQSLTPQGSISTVPPGVGASPGGAVGSSSLLTMQQLVALQTVTEAQLKKAVEVAPKEGAAVVDPQNSFLTRVPVPLTQIEPTRGFVEMVDPANTRPCHSVCVRHHQGNCINAEQCSNIHVARDYLVRSREEGGSLCCPYHNDYYTRVLYDDNVLRELGKSFIMLLEDRSEAVISRRYVSYTAALEQLPTRNGSKTISVKKDICRLHLEKRCKWTKDCGHIHVCRDLLAALNAVHYPSLCFLLMANTDADTIVTKLQSNSQLLSFVRSEFIDSIVDTLIEVKNAESLRALVSVGAALTDEQQRVINNILATSSAQKGPRTPTRLVEHQQQEQQQQQQPESQNDLFQISSTTTTKSSSLN